MAPSRPVPMLLLHALFFVSGACGLVYEVVWVRQLGNVFGNTVYSASLVTAVFMGGLGVGSYLAGGWVDRRVRETPAAPLRAYGVAELVIASMGALLALILPRLAPVAARLTAYAEDGAGWYEPSYGSLALRYAAATVLLALPTMAMGATFTLLVRYALLRGVGQAGWKVGVLYGVNTAGAAGGACLTDLVLVPAVGLLRTQLVTALAQVIVGIVALILSSRDFGPSAIAPPVATEAPRMRRAGSALRAACATLFLSGFAALGMELVWFRGLSAALGALRPVFSIILALILCGLWLGALAGGAAQNRFGRPVQLLLVTQGFFVLASLGLVATFTRPAGTPYGVALHAAAYVVLLPAFLMGFSMPLVQAIAQDAVGHVGRRAGALYLANTAGGVAGSLFAGFVLAPWVGTQVSFVVMAACAALAPVPLVLASEDKTRAMVVALAISATASVPAMGAWLALPPTFLLSRFLPPLPEKEQVLAVDEGVNEVVVVSELPGGERRLSTNGHPMSGTQMKSQRYMRSFAHVPLLMMERPTSAIVICFGVGSTLNATALHRSLDRIDLADLSRNVLEHASYFRSANHHVLKDPRVRVAVNDGRQHLQMQPEGTYDLVTLEPPPIVFAGVSALYSREFYEIARSRLKPGGMITQWLPAYQTNGDEILALVKAFVDVFPRSALLSGYGRELVLLGTTAPELVFDLDRVARNLEADPSIRADPANVEIASLTELVGTFVADAATLRRATESVSPLTDDRPSLEYSVLRFVAGKADAIPASLFDTRTLPGFCPKCFAPTPDPRVAWLDRYLLATGRLYASSDFLTNKDTLVVDLSGLAETINESAYLRDMFGKQVGADQTAVLRDRVRHAPDDAQARFALAFALAHAGLVDDALDEQRHGVALAPGDAEAHYNLGALLLTRGRSDEGIEEMEKVLTLAPDHPRANAVLCDVRKHDDPRGRDACRRAAPRAEAVK